jgi:aspartyl/asparaginyl-tRNA synthetase
LIIKSVKKNCEKEIRTLRRELTLPKTPFKQVKYKDAYQKYGEEFE